MHASNGVNTTDLIAPENMNPKFALGVHRQAIITLTAHMILFAWIVDRITPALHASAQSIKGQLKHTNLQLLNN